MARLPRLECPSFPHLVVQRLVDGVALTRDADDRLLLWQILMDAARTHEVAIHAYVLLPDHFYLLVTPARSGGLGLFMQAVGRRYVASYNRRHARQGGLWAGRFRATVLDPARYLLDAMVFIETHPWRLGLASGEWTADPGLPSSLDHHLNRRTDALIQDHAAFWALGNTPFDREAAWRARLSQGLGDSVVLALSQAASKGWVLGDEVFVRRLQQAAQAGSGGGRRLAPAPRGRPPKRAALAADDEVLVGGVG